MTVRARTRRRVHRLSSPPLVVTIDEGSTDPLISFVLASRPHSGVSLRYTELTVFSRGRPWSLVDGELQGPVRISSSSTRITIVASISGFRVSDTLSIAHGRVRLRRRWRRVDPASGAWALGTRISGGRGTHEKITLPHVLYNDNPAADPTMLVAHLPKRAGQALIVEEHRLPIPGINVEWRADDRKTYALTLLSEPSTIALASAQPDHSWTIGGIHRGDHLDLVSLSGVVAFNGDKDLIYTNQRTTAPYPGGGYLPIAAGDILEKTLFIELHRCEAEGRGFRRLVHLGWQELKPATKPVLSLQRVIALKGTALESRWRERADIGGFAWIPDTREEGNVYGAHPGFLFGWTGQSLRLAWCSIHLGLRSGDRRWLDRAFAVMDSIATAPQVSGIAGLPYLYYHWSDETWHDAKRRHQPEGGGWRASEDLHEVRISSRMLGETLADLAECILLLRARGLPVREYWMDALRRMTGFLTAPGRLTRAGIFPIFYLPDGTAEEGLV
ncbi:MAG: hypothetical protein H0V44_10870, partial [Planctomycetes bacterium]|nr:hypothetical protein [Planctomycetota bacterium]